jgi:hypothetical protein
MPSFSFDPIADATAVVALLVMLVERLPQKKVLDISSNESTSTTAQLGARCVDIGATLI